MALGTPCVATPVTGIPEVLQHEQTGLLVPEGAHLALAQQLDRLLAGAPPRARLAGAARTRGEAVLGVRWPHAQRRGPPPGAGPPAELTRSPPATAAP